MRWLIVGSTLVVAASLGCSGKPADQPNQGAHEPAKPIEQPKDRIRPIALTTEDWKTALPREYPAVLREGMSDEQLARDLELQVWAFEFSEGPLRCWLEFEESGQQTMPPREPSRGDWKCDAKEGLFVFSVGRGESERMKGVMRKLGKDAHPESVTFNLRFRSLPEGSSGSFGTSHGSSPLWFGWPGEKKFAVRADPVGTANAGEAFTVLRVECVEPDRAKKDSSRKAVLVLKGALGQAPKE